MYASKIMMDLIAAGVCFGQQAANDNANGWARIQELQRAVQLEQMRHSEAVKARLISAWGRVINA